MVGFFTNTFIVGIRKWESASERTKDPTDVRPEDVTHPKRKSASERTKDSTEDVVHWKRKSASERTKDSTDLHSDDGKHRV